MDTMAWRSAIWRKLFSTRSKDDCRDEKSYGRDEEEAHELLSPSSHTDEDEDPVTDSPRKDDSDTSVKQPQIVRTEIDGTEEDSPSPVNRRSSWLAAIILLVTVVIGLVISYGVVIRTSSKSQTISDSSLAAETHSSHFSTMHRTATTDTTPVSTSAPKIRYPIIRHSWAALSPVERQNYIAALQCLRNFPPLLPHMPTNASAYSDYPYIHAHIGYRTHNAASFLPWHRYFLCLYEFRLRESCGYNGGIPYWDWTADADFYPHADLSASSVFHKSDGFGGNGDPNGPITVGRHGRCLTTGPFAGLQVFWYDVKYQPHCLSRGFRTDSNSNGDGDGAKIDGSALTTAEIDKILHLDTYEAFVGALEKKVHDVIPFGVGGDFETFSAPFEPLFWLHHAQLDRLWSMWQRRRRGLDRVFEYGGHRFRHSIEMAGLDDLIEMGGVLGRDVKVKEVMDVKGGCVDGRVGEDTEEETGIMCVEYA